MQVRYAVKQLPPDPSSRWILGPGPAGPDGSLQVTTRCPHGGCAVHMLADGLEDRPAAAFALAYSTAALGCDCWDEVWPNYRAPDWPEEMRTFIARAWPGGVGNSAALGNELSVLFDEVQE